MNMRITRTCIAIFHFSFFIFHSAIWAGTLDSPAAPTDSTSVMFTQDDLYNRLTIGASGTKASAFVDPTSAPGSTRQTNNDIMAVMPLKDNLNGAGPENISVGKKYWGLKDGGWGVQTGTMVNVGQQVINTPGTSSQTITQGYHNGTATVAGEANLLPGNIVNGVTVFGVTGNIIDLVNTGSGDATTSEIGSGKKAWVDGSEVTGIATFGSGDLLTCNGTLNGTRWCDNGDGTVADMTNGLVWLQNANCWGTMDWNTAILKPITDLKGDNTVCSLNDGSVWGDWRLPTKAELFNLANGTEPVRTNTPRAFTGFGSGSCWSSSTDTSNTANAWIVALWSDGHTISYPKSISDNYVLSVREGCGSNNLDLCASNSTCTSAGGAWWSDNRCLGVPESETVISAGGKVWMDRNLGASQVATSSTDSLAYGDLYQWGRGADGHQLRDSPVTSLESLSSTDVPGHGDFILTNVSYDWRVPQNDNLWQGVSGINNPCPSGFRLPTETEWQTEIDSWGSLNSTGAFASPLKLVAAGYRFRNDGSLYNAGINGSCWSSTVNGSNSRFLYFSSGNAYMLTNYRADGFSARCIED